MEYKIDLSQKVEFCQQLPYFFEKFGSVQEPRIKCWFDVPITQMSIFILFASIGLLFEGTFSLWVSLMDFTVPESFIGWLVAKNCWNLFAGFFLIKTSYWENRSLFMNQKLCWGFNSPDWCIAFDYILILSVVEINFLWFMAILKYIICRCNDTELPRLVTVFFIRCYFEISYSSR